MIDISYTDPELLSLQILLTYLIYSGLSSFWQVISQAKVCGITNESDTVKRLRLAIANKDFTFKAGQW